jgi:putative hydrolase
MQFESGGGSLSQGDNVTGNTPAGPDQPGFGGGFNPADMAAMFGQLSRMYSGGDPMDLSTLVTTSRQLVAAEGPDPSVTAAEAAAVADAVHLAEMWVDPVTGLSAGTGMAHAWSRAEWVEGTAVAWRTLLLPLVEQLQRQSRTDLEEATKAAGPEAPAAGLDLSALSRMMSPMIQAMLSQQVAAGVAKLATQVLGGADVGLPLTDTSVRALLPANIKLFAESLERDPAEVRLYLALRESAHARLHHTAPWLLDRIQTVLGATAAGSTPQLGDLSDLFATADPSDPESMMRQINDRMEQAADSPEQRARESHLETLLALVIGWVDDVVGQAAIGRMPSEPALSEALRRRRAAGGPTEQVFAELAGLELRPRRAREAAALFARLREVGGPALRDKVWQSAQFVPGSSDLDDPEAFVSAMASPDPDLSALEGLFGEHENRPDGSDEADGGASETPPPGA